MKDCILSKTKDVYSKYKLFILDVARWLNIWILVLFSWYNSWNITFQRHAFFPIHLIPNLAFVFPFNDWLNSLQLSVHPLKWFLMLDTYAYLKNHSVVELYAFQCCIKRNTRVSKFLDKCQNSVNHKHSHDSLGNNTLYETQLEIPFDESASW